MTVIPITDPGDPRIAGYRDIRERDLVGRQGLFVAEGEVVLRVLTGSPHFEAVSVLVADKRLAKLQPILGELGGASVYAASQAVIDSIAGFHLHRGILALARRRTTPSAAELLRSAPPGSVVLVLLGIANHDNMGGLFRNAAAFGAHAVLLDPHCCDPLYRKAIRVSVGGVLTTPFARLAPDEDAVLLLRARGFEAFGFSPTGGLTLGDTPKPPRAALFLGSEGPGLDESVLARTTRVSVPMAPGFDSLNVATCAAIALHHFKFVGT